MADLTVAYTGSVFELRGWTEFTASASAPKNRLFRIDMETGAATQLSDSGLINPAGVGLATQPDETLFFSGYGANGLLHTLTVAGVATSVATISGSGQTGSINAMSSWKNGALVASVELAGANRMLISIGSNTAAATPIGNTVNNLDALAFSACTVHGIPNSGFGPGVASWTSVGAVEAVTEDFGVQSQIGAHLAYLSTASLGGPAPVDAATLDSLAGGPLSSIATDTVVEGSAMRVEFETQMAAILFVRGQFLTNEGTPSSFNDFSFVSTGTASLFSDTNNSSFDPSYFTTFAEQGAGYFEEFLPIGSHFVSLGVADVRDASVDSALLVDQVVLHRSFLGHVAGTVEACNVLSRVRAIDSPVINNIDLAQTTLVPVELTDLPDRPAVTVTVTPASLEPLVRIEFSDCLGHVGGAFHISNLDVEREEDGTRYSKVYHYFRSAGVRDGEVCGYQISGLPGAVGIVAVTIGGETRIPEAGADPPIVVCTGEECGGLLEDPDRAAANFIPEEGGDFRWLDDASLHGKGICTGPDEQGPPMTGNGDIATYEYILEAGATGWDCCTYQWTGLDGVDSEVGYVVFQLPEGSFPVTPNNDADELLDLCDDDDDNDGLPDTAETGTGIYVSPSDTGTDPLLFDTDGDGYGDWEEVQAGTDPNDFNSQPGSPEVPALSRPLQSLLVLLLLGIGSVFILPGLPDGRFSRRS